MRDLSGTYPVIYMKKEIGSLIVWEDGIHINFDMKCLLPDNRVYRLYCEYSGLFIQIGVTVPDCGNLKMRKSFTKNEIKAMGLYGIENCFISCKVPDFVSETKEQKVLTENEGNFWQPFDKSRKIFIDEELSEAAEGLSDALEKEENGFRFLAVPLFDDKPFELMICFSLGELENINGNQFVVFKTKNGKFIFS